MTKVVKAILLVFVLTAACSAIQAQSFRVQYYWAENAPTMHLSDTFSSKLNADEYLANVVSELRRKGYLAASLDSVVYNSMSAKAYFYLGGEYGLAHVHTQAADEELLSRVAWPTDSMSFETFNFFQQRILDALEDNGHPFASVSLEKSTLSGSAVEGWLRIDRGPAYYIDSIRVYGNAQLKKDFLMQYLQLEQRMLYNRTRIAGISEKLAQLSFLTEQKPADVSFLGTGAVVNIYLQQRRASSVQALVGFLPSTDIRFKRRMLLAVDANVQLKNAFGNGESLSVVWQQLQQQSPRLDFRFEYPFIFKTPFSLQTAFDMFRQDSSFVNLNLSGGIAWRSGTRRQGSLFLQHQKTLVNSIDTFQVIQQRQLPGSVDVSSVNAGLSYLYNHTDYRPSPRRGTVLEITGTGGRKSFKRNNLITGLKDPADPAFAFASLYDSLPSQAAQFRISGKLQQFIPLGKQVSALVGVNGGWYYSPAYFRNELFRIGGYRLLRGFNDESQYVSQYLITTAELRYFIGPQSAFFAFVDGGAGNHAKETPRYHSYLSGGLGLTLETKAGILQLAWAVGKRDDTNLDLKQSKIHIGFAGFF